MPSQRYQIFHKRGYWNRMEKESFEGLIKDYEEYGGKNSFVHETSEKEYPTWKLVN